MINSKLTEYLLFLNSLLVNWDKLTQDNTGYYVNKISFCDSYGQHLLTKDELIKRIDMFKNSKVFRKIKQKN